MPRRGFIPKREVLPDPVYQSPLVTRFINCLMHDGKKSTAQAVFYDALGIIHERISDVEPIEVRYQVEVRGSATGVPSGFLSASKFDAVAQCGGG